MNNESEPKTGGTARTPATAERPRRWAGRLSGEFLLFHETAPIGYFMLGRDTEIINANISGGRIFGRSPLELQGRKFESLIVESDRDCFRTFLMRVIESDEWQECEATVSRPDGSQVFALLQGRNLAEAGEIVVFVTDITKRRAAEIALRESELKYKDVADRLAEGVFEADTLGQVTYANLKVLSSLGLGAEDLKRGLSVFDVIAPSSLDLAKQRFASVMGQADVGAGEYELLRRDGSTFPALVHSLAVVKDGQVVGVRGILVDISERKRAETALEESERRYRELTDLLDESVFEMDLQGRFTYANRKAMSSLGIDKSDLERGLSVFDIVSAGELDRAKDRMAAALTRGDTGVVEFLIVRKDGTMFPALTHGSAIERNGSVVGIRGIVFDISGLKKAEQALRESERRFRTLLKSLHEGIWVLDQDDRTTFVNPRMAEMLGYAEDEMIGQPVYAFNDEEWKKFTAAKMERRRARAQGRRTGLRAVRDVPHPGRRRAIYGIDCGRPGHHRA
jgi:PAS domain S-box-containing protein